MPPVAHIPPSSLFLPTVPVVAWLIAFHTSSDPGQALTAFSVPAQRKRYFDLYAPGVVLHGYDGVDPGPDSGIRYYHAFWTAFPDARVTAEDILETPDKVVVRFSMTGTHRGSFLGLAGTGKPVRLSGMTILRFEGEKCIERWSVTDSLALVVQLGIFIPQTSAPPAN